MLHLRSVIVVFALTASVAVAEPPPMTEFEARVAGRTALQERRWNDAIAAYARCAASRPAPRPMGYDPRTQILVADVQAILDELTARGAGVDALLPYWDFLWQSFPFFEGYFDLGDAFECTEPLAWLDVYRKAAEARVARDDPSKSDPRFAPCRLLAAHERDGDTDAAVEFLRTDFPADHHAQDYGLCAYLAIRVLRNSDDDSNRCALYLSRFAESPLVSIMLHGERYPYAMAMERTRNPIARRWLSLDTAFGREEHSREALRALAELHVPWVTPALVRVWEFAADIAYPGDYDQPAGYRLLVERRLAELQNEIGDVPELGMARYYATAKLFHWWDDMSAVPKCAYWQTWETSHPEDPWLAWGRLYIAYGRQLVAYPAPLADADRQGLERIARQYERDVLGLVANSFLAEDDEQRDDCPSARSRYEAMLAFDQGGNRTPAPLAADFVRGTAVNRMAAWYSTRDRARYQALPRDLYRSHDSPFGEWRDDFACGTGALAYAEYAHFEEIESRLESGDVEGALSAFRADMFDRDYHFDATLRFSRICVEHKMEGRVSLEVLALEELARHQSGRRRIGLDSGRDGKWTPIRERTPLPLESAAFLADFLEVLAEVRAGSIESILSGIDALRIERHPGLRILDVPRLQVVGAAVSSVPDFGARAGPFLRPERGVPAIVLATMIDSPAALELLLETAYRGTGLAAEIAWGARRIAEEDCLRALLRRVIQDGFVRWEWMRARLNRFSDDEVLRVLTDLRADAEPALQDAFDVEIERIREDSRWWHYCKTGK